MSEPGPSYTVLRIKRKATEHPLSSLVIQDEPARAKKQRQINPLGKSRGVFRLAETVPETWKGKGEEGAVLRERIRGLLSAGQVPSPTPSPGPAGSQLAKTDIQQTEATKESQPQTSSGPSEPTKGTSSPPEQTSPPIASTSITSALPSRAEVVSPAESGKPSASAQEQLKALAKLKYRVVPPVSSHMRAMMPPTVMTYADEANVNPLTFVDAEAVSAGPSRKASLPSAEEQKEMAPFLSMLEDVLNLESPGGRSRTEQSEAETYVYDLYYRDNRLPTSESLPLGAGDGVHIGALLGYDDEDDDDSQAGSEPEDEADEDSNDEDYYRNDYPEDEDADEDMEGYKDAFDDDEEDYEAERNSDDDRGLWDYRD